MKAPWRRPGAGLHGALPWGGGRGSINGRLSSAWALCLVPAVIAVALLIAIIAPASTPAHLIAGLIPVPDVAASDFKRAIGTAAEAPSDAREHFFDLAEAAAVREVRAAPFKPDAWLHLALAQAERKGRLTQAALTSLDRSFEVAPIDAKVAAWRAYFALTSWTALPQAIRTKVTAELKTVWTANPERRDELAAAVSRVASSEGRAAGEAALSEAGWRPPPPDQSPQDGAIPLAQHGAVLEELPPPTADDPSGPPASAAPHSP